MRFISLLLALLVTGYLLMTYLGTSTTDSGQATSRPKETIDRAEQQINQAVDDYQKKMDKSINSNQ